MALAVMGASVWLGWPTTPYATPLVAVAIVSGLALGIARRPSRLRAARVADRQSSLKNRLATAVEILDGRIATELDALQLIETARVLTGLPARRAFPRSSVAARNGVLLLSAAGAIFAVVAVVVRPPAPAVSDATPTSDTAPRLAEATDVPQDAIAPRQLEQMRTRSLTEQAALAQLGQQLRTTAAARDIGAALQRGDVATASALLNQLALESDQLSQPAKQELAGALLDASKGTAALDKNLAAAELAATMAMTRSSYQASRTALQALAAAVLDSQNGTLSQQQLIAQIQQLERDVAAQTGGNGTDCGVLTDDGEFFQDCSTVGQVPSSGAMGVVSRGSGQSPSAGVGEVAGGRGFASSGVDLDPLGQAPTRLDLPTADVPVDLAPAGAQGNGTPSEPSSPTIAIGESHQANVQQAGVQQASEPITQDVERTVVGPADRGLLRDFFRATDPGRP